jgi:hypothetical protein
MSAGLCVSWLMFLLGVRVNGRGVGVYVPLTTAETAKVRRRVVVFCWRATRARDWRCGLVSYDVAHKRGA